MGLGKTIQTLVHIQRERQQGAEGPVLLVCPTSVISNWQHEAARFTPGLRVLVHHGSERARGETLPESFKGHDIVLTSYSLMQRDAAALAQVRVGRRRFGRSPEHQESREQAGPRRAHAQQRLSDRADRNPG